MINMTHSTEYLKREFIEKKKLVILSVTKRCNLCCKYCRTKDRWYDALGQKATTVDLHKEDWVKVLDICRNAGEILITGGEPAEYPLITEFMSFLTANQIRYSIHTNGTSKKWSTILAYCRENNLRPDIHLSTELFPALQKEIRGCKLPLQFIINAKKQKMLVEIKVTLHERLLPYLNRLERNLRSWVGRGIDSMFFQPVALVGNQFPTGLELKKDFIPILLKLKELKAKDRVLGKIIRKSETGFDIIISLLEGTDLYKKEANKCRACNQIIFLNPDLTIMNCKTLWGRARKLPCSEFFDFICCGFQP